MVKQSKPRLSPAPGAAQDDPDFSRDFDDSQDAQLQLAGHFMIAMPSMLDPVFGGAVVYICEHNSGGALGIIINKPTDMTLDILLERLDLTLEIQANDYSPIQKIVMFGGPVQVERGFVLHQPPIFEFSSMVRIDDRVALTTSKDVLEAVAAGEGPRRLLVTLGCAGWSAGQLEQEIAQNGWLTVQADPAIIFETPVHERFAAAMKLLGIDPLLLSGEAGHA